MKRKWAVLLFISILLLDQITKYAAQQTLSADDPIEVIPGLFNLTLVYNSGAAFGLFSGLSDVWRRVALIGVSIFALLIIIRFYLVEAKGDSWSQFALVAILAGAVGNIIDRFRFDRVVDFLDFYLAAGLKASAAWMTSTAGTERVKTALFSWLPNEQARKTVFREQTPRGFPCPRRRQRDQPTTQVETF